MTVPIAAIIGGGPAGLMTAETLAQESRAEIHVFDAMPSVGRKFLLAGKGGLNLTHSEPFEGFLKRYGPQASQLRPYLSAFGPKEIVAWAKGLGVETFIGSSGRVFPVDFKAAPLLRAWLRRLRERGITFHLRHRWRGWGEGDALHFETPDEPLLFKAEATILALGGASWPQLGSDGAWAPLLTEAGVAVNLLRPANCGFDVGWSDHFRSRFAGTPVKSVKVGMAGRNVRGDFVITETGVEGSALYALGPTPRDEIARQGDTTLLVDLAPDRALPVLIQALAQPRGSRSLSTHLRRTLGLDGVKAALLRECLPRDAFESSGRLARWIKAVPLRLTAPRPVAEAISTAGGVSFDALTDDLMLQARPGLFCAGEMLDWEAITGGYLLTACFALGHAAGQGAAAWLARPQV